MIRRAVPSDLNDLLTLFKNTISFINSRDYNPQQTEAWISSIHDRERWLDKIQKQYFILYLEGGRVLGFASLDQGRHIDLLYVHHKRQGEGIASRLLKDMETEALRLPARPLVLSAHVSKTALPFFQSKGFVVEQSSMTSLSSQIKSLSKSNFITGQPNSMNI